MHEYYATVAAAPLRLVKGGVRRFDQVRLVDGVRAGGQREAEADRHPDRGPALGPQLCRDDGPHAIGERRRVVPVCLPAQDDELFPAEAGEDVFRARRRGEAPGDLAQDLIAEWMTVLVVDALEVIDVGDHQRERFAMAVGERELGAQALVERASIVETGEPVVHGRLVELPGELLVERVLVGELQDGRPAHRDLVAVAEDSRAGDSRAVDEGSVGRIEIVQDGPIPVQPHGGVMARDAVVVEAKVDVVASSQDRLRLGELEHLSEPHASDGDQVG